MNKQDFSLKTMLIGRDFDEVSPIDMTVDSGEFFATRRLYHYLSSQLYVGDFEKRINRLYWMWMEHVNNSNALEAFSPPKDFYNDLRSAYHGRYQRFKWLGDSIVSGLAFLAFVYPYMSLIIDDDTDELPDDFYKLILQINEITNYRVNPNISILESDYTYNHSNLLDQDFIYQLVHFKNRGTMAIVSAHIGADAREGFSDILFASFVEENHLIYNDELDEYTAVFIDYDSIFIHCPECGAEWDFEVGTFLDVTDEQLKNVQEKDGKLICPVCGEGELSAY